MKKARNAVSAGLASTPREPLLFLYPQWARKSSSASEAVLSTSTILCCNDTSQDTPSISALESSLPPPSAAAIENAKPFEHRLDHAKKTITPSTSRRPRNNGSLSRILQHQRLERKVVRILWANKEASNSAYRALEAKKDFQAKRRARMFETHIVNWREILGDLKEHTPDYGPWLEQALSIVIPPSSMRQLFHSIDASMWEIAKKYSCSVRLGERDTENKCRTFIVSGPLTALAKVVADLIRSHPDVEISRVSKSKSEDPKDLVALDDIINSNGRIRPIKVRLARIKDTKRKRSRREFTRPTVWTPDTFLEHLRAIVDPSVTAHWRQFGLEAPVDHRRIAPGLLMELFTDPQCRASITTTACHEAMEYLIKVNLMVDLRVLFVHMERMQIPTDSELFNVMLEGAAKNRDLHNFRLILHLMLKRGHLPNSGTWIAFIRAFSDIDVKAHVVTAMKSKGLASSRRITRIICAELVTAEISSSLENSQSHEEFVAYMDAKYGEDWLSANAANRILHVMGLRGLISRCWEFLHFMASRFEPPDQVSVNTIIGCCYDKSQRNLTGAVELLQNLPSTTNFIPDPYTYEMLFVMAWGLRQYNVARVVWRYACLSAATSFKMRELMFTHLKEAGLGHISRTENARRKELLGPLVLGSSYQRTHPVEVVQTHIQEDHFQTPSATKHLSVLNNTWVRHKPGPDSGTANSTQMDSQSSSVETVLLSRLSGSSVDETTKPAMPGDDAAVKISSATQIKDVAHESSDESKLSDQADSVYTVSNPLCPGVSTKSLQSEDHVNVKTSPATKGGDAAIQKVSDEAEVSAPADEVCSWKPLLPHGQPNPKKRSQIQALQELLELDYKAFRDWQPARPFADMLARALRKDNHWKTRLNKDKEKPDFEASLKWMLDEAIAIPVRKKADNWYHAQKWWWMSWK